jgi:glycosyltransferase involved in cell wall biosynthesis
MPDLHPSSLRILYLITGLRMGGAEQQLLLIAHNMQKHGHQVIVVAMETGGVMVNEFVKKGIPVVELNMGRVKMAISGYTTFNKLVRDFKPHFIHAHMIHANLLSRIYKFFHPKQLVVNTAHNIREGSARLMIAYRLTRQLANWSTNVSTEAYSHFIAKGYFDPKTSCALPNAINTGKFKKDSSASPFLRQEFGIETHFYVFFTAGRLHEQKNHQMLINAFAEVCKINLNTLLLIAGEGPLEAELKQLAVKLGIQAKVKFIGRRDDMPQLFNVCDCFVLSSIYEGFGLVVGEAMACEKPVIATNCGGVKEVMGAYGKLIETNDTPALTQAMVNRLQQPATTSELVCARQSIQTRFAVEEIISQWLNLYHQINKP